MFQMEEQVKCRGFVMQSPVMDLVEGSVDGTRGIKGDSELYIEIVREVIRVYERLQPSRMTIDKMAGRIQTN
jgi:hypothetical protein